MVTWPRCHLLIYRFLSLKAQVISGLCLLGLNGTVGGSVPEVPEDGGIPMLSPQPCPTLPMPKPSPCPMLTPNWTRLSNQKGRRHKAVPGEFPAEEKS